MGGRTANEYGVSSWGDENVLYFIMVVFTTLNILLKKKLLHCTVLVDKLYGMLVVSQSWDEKKISGPMFSEFGGRMISNLESCSKTII